MWNALRKWLFGSASTTWISALELSDLLSSLPHKFITFDLRSRREVEKYPYTIPGALLSSGSDLAGLLRWLPPQNFVVFYGTDDISQGRTLHGLTQSSNFFSLKGGLRAWREARLATERANLQPALSHTGGRLSAARFAPEKDAEIICRSRMVAHRMKWYLKTAPVVLTLGYHTRILTTARLEARFELGSRLQAIGADGT